MPRYNAPPLAQVQTGGNAVNRAYNQPLYDTAVILQAAPGNTIQFFQIPQGQPITYQGATVTKTPWHSNMQVAGMLSTPNQFWLFGFRLEIEEGVTLASFEAIQKWGVFDWYFGNNSWLTIPMTQMPQGVGTDGFGGTTAVPRQGQALPLFYDMRIPDSMGNMLPLQIEPNESFRGQLSFPAGSAAPYADTYIRLYAVGIKEGQI
jgi:hypothetical protein